MMTTRRNPVARIWVRGRPRAASSRGARPTGPYRKSIADTARAAVPKPIASQRISIEVWFSAARGARADVDNVLKPILDSLKGVVFNDDRQVRSVKVIVLPNDDAYRITDWTSETVMSRLSKGGTTENIWFYDMEHDGYSLDDKRQKVVENDIPDVLDCWTHRRDAKFQQRRDQRLADLQKQITPLKKDRLEHHAIIHRLKFEEVVSKAADEARAAREKAEAELAELQSRMTPLQTEINQLTRQFWVTKDQVKANKYDLSASRYRQVERDEEFYEQPRVTLDRLRQLEAAATGEVTILEEMLGKS